MMRPNIVLMIAHDLGCYLNCYGIETVQTPRLDQMACEGARFANSFCVAPGCSPSRASLFTGRYPHCNGVLGLTHGLFEWDLHADERHLAGLLHDAGYYSALCGLQHETLRPQEMGYDEIVSQETPIGDETLTGCDRVAAQVAQFVQERDTSQPFYLQVGFFEPHRAPRSPGEFGPMPPDHSRGVTVPGYLVDDEGAREEFAHYQGAIAKLDGAVGRVLDAIDSAEMRDNTLVLFTTDHGIPFPRAKCSVYDPGLETCLLMRHPQSLRGQVFDEMIPHIDILPTLLELLELEAPATLQGRSFAPLLRGQEYEANAQVFGELTYHDYYDPIRCIRTPDWKLIVSFCYNTALMNPSQMYRPKCITKTPPNPTLSRHDLVELYDLKRDPLEQTNLASQDEHAQIKSELLHRLNAWMHETQDPLLQGVPVSPMHTRALAALEGARANS